MDYLARFLEDTGGVGFGVVILPRFDEARESFTDSLESHGPENAAFIHNLSALQFRFPDGVFDFRYVESRNDVYKYGARHYRWMWVDPRVGDFETDFMLCSLRNPVGLDNFFNGEKVDLGWWEAREASRKVEV